MSDKTARNDESRIPTFPRPVLWGLLGGTLAITGLAGAQQLTELKGVPPELAYVGTLSNEDGAVNGQVTMSVNVMATTEDASPCTVGPQQVDVVNGRFAVSLHGCTSKFLHVRDVANQPVLATVTVVDPQTGFDVTFPPKSVGAVPYALSAAYAARGEDFQTTTLQSGSATLGETEAQSLTVTGSATLGETEVQSLTVTGRTYPGDFEIRLLSCSAEECECANDEVMLTGGAFCPNEQHRLIDSRPMHSRRWRALCRHMDNSTSSTPSVRVTCMKMAPPPTP